MQKYNPIVIAAIAKPWNELDGEVQEGVKLLAQKAKEKNKVICFYIVGLKKSGFVANFEEDDPKILPCPKLTQKGTSVAVYVLGHGKEGMLFHDVPGEVVDPESLAGKIDGIGKAMGIEVGYVNFVACSLVPEKGAAGEFVTSFMRALACSPLVASYNVAVFLRPQDKGRKYIVKGGGSFGALASAENARNIKRIFKVGGEGLMARKHVNKARLAKGMPDSEWTALEEDPLGN